LDEIDGGVQCEEFAGRSGCENKSVIHSVTIALPIKGVSGQLLEFVGAVRGRGMRFLELFVGAPIISADAKIAVRDVNVFGFVVRRFAHNVWARRRG
jgi:hypothetical protein